VSDVPEGRRDYSTSLSGLHGNKRVLETTIKPFRNQLKFLQNFFGFLPRMEKYIPLPNKEKGNDK